MLSNCLSASPIRSWRSFTRKVSSLPLLAGSVATRLPLLVQHSACCATAVQRAASDACCTRVLWGGSRRCQW
jgi:hypothetical protein